MFNNEINIEYRGKHVFDLAIKLAFTSEYERDKPTQVCGYKIKDNKMFLFAYGDDKREMVKFPYKMELDEATSFIWGWLQKTDPIGKYPDTDGSVEKGFQVTTEGTDWRGGSEFYGSFIAIKPIWIVYGK